MTGASSSSANSSATCSSSVSYSSTSSSAPAKKSSIDTSARTSVAALSKQLSSALLMQAPKATSAQTNNDSKSVSHRPRASSEALSAAKVHAVNDTLAKKKDSATAKLSDTTPASNSETTEKANTATATKKATTTDTCTTSHSANQMTTPASVSSGSDVSRPISMSGMGKFAQAVTIFKSAFTSATSAQLSSDASSSGTVQARKMSTTTATATQPKQGTVAKKQVQQQRIIPDANEPISVIFLDIEHVLIQESDEMIHQVAREAIELGFAKDALVADPSAEEDFTSLQWGTATSHMLSKTAVSNLDTLIQTANQTRDVFIVITSRLRKGVTADDLCVQMFANHKFSKLIIDKLIDPSARVLQESSSSTIRFRDRASEIEYWLQQHSHLQIKSFVILDSNGYGVSSVRTYKKCSVKVHRENLLSQKDVAAALSILAPPTKTASGSEQKAVMSEKKTDSDETTSKDNAGK